jgi:glutamine amidotransferase
MITKKTKICIVDYGFGNIASIENALDYLKFDYSSQKIPKDLDNFSHIILPGVGSFEAGMGKLTELGWETNIKNFVKKGGYLFGICLGMQLLFKHGTDEKTDQIIEGLGFFEGKCKKFFQDKRTNKLPLPHVGFNEVIHKNTKIWNGIKNPSYFYFIHSYRIYSSENSYDCAKTIYGEEFISFIEKSKVFGSQFHPEKSHLIGLNLIQNFCNLQ